MITVPREEILIKLRTENPWWSDPGRRVPQYARLEPRAYLDLLMPLVTNLAVRRAVVVMGPRRVGKTVMLHHVISRLLDNGVDPATVLYISMDQPLYDHLSLDQVLDLFREATGHPSEGAQSYVFVDEIQYLKEWERHLKSLVDRHPDTKLIASGSAAAALKLKSQESGAGRFTEFLLPPLTFYEYLKLLKEDGRIHVEDDLNTGTKATTSDLAGVNDLFIDYINFGGYPEVVTTPEIRNDPVRFIKSDIIDKVLLRDLPSLYGIRDIQELNSLFTNLAYNTSQEVSLDELSKSSGVAKNTIRRYITYLEAAFLIRTVNRIDETCRHFKRANFFKSYLTNPSLRAALFSPAATDDKHIGSLVETAIFSQWFHADDLDLYYARWQKGRTRGEVDIVSVGAGRSNFRSASRTHARANWAVEVKWSDRVVEHPDELAGLVEFCATNKLRSALVTTRTVERSLTVRGVQIHFEPASTYCFILGRNLILGRSQVAGSQHTSVLKP